MIKNISFNAWIKSLRLFCLALFITVFCCLEVTANTRATITVTKTNYQGWRDSYILSNGQVEAVVVPKVGQIMQFRFKGGEGTFWENDQVYGKAPNVKSGEWGYFGAHS